MRRLRSVLSPPFLLVAAILLIGAGAAAWWAYRGTPAQSLSYTYSGIAIIAQLPAGEAATLVVLVVPEAGDARARDLSDRLLGAGVATILVPLPELLVAASYGTSDCLDLGGTLHAVAKDAEHHLGFADFRVPLLAGTAAGAQAAYLGYRQGSAGTWTGVVTVMRTPDIALPKPPCLDWGSPGRLPGTYVIDSRHRAGEAWIDMPDLSDARFDALVGPLLAQARADAGNALPLTMTEPDRPDPAAPLVVLYSGDGGWAGLDRKLAAQFAVRGYETAGISSLQYFWKERQPAEAARDLQRLIAERAGARGILLVGYSFGADVLPFIYEALSPATRARIVGLDLLGVATTADFEFHLTSWADVPSSEAKATGPVLDRLEGTAILCIRGKEEAQSACPAVRNPAVRQIVLPGDHHFDNDAKAVVDALIGPVR